VSGRRNVTELLSPAPNDYFENIVSWQLDAVGPTIALAPPGGSLSSLAAAREYATGEEWLSHVESRIDEAAIVAISLSATDGLLREVRVATERALARIVLIFPPGRRRRTTTTLGRSPRRDRDRCRHRAAARPSAHSVRLLPRTPSRRCRRRSARRGRVPGCDHEGRRASPDRIAADAATTTANEARRSPSTASAPASSPVDEFAITTRIFSTPHYEPCLRSPPLPNSTRPRQPACIRYARPSISMPTSGVAGCAPCAGAPSSSIEVRRASSL